MMSIRCYMMPFDLYTRQWPEKQQQQQCSGNAEALVAIVVVTHGWNKWMWLPKKGKKKQESIGKRREMSQRHLVFC